METIMTEAATAQDWRISYIVLGAVALGIGMALISGFITSAWILDPLQNSLQSQEHRQHVSEQRERRTCLVVALLCYYIPALLIVGFHAGLAGLAPYLRAHLLDGFGCAALFALALSPLRRPLAEASHRYKPGLEAVGQGLRAGLLLTCASVAIAASGAWTAGGNWPAVLLAGICASFPLQFFWGIVALGISAAPLTPRLDS